MGERMKRAQAKAFRQREDIRYRVLTEPTLTARCRTEQYLRGYNCAVASGRAVPPKGTRLLVHIDGGDVVILHGYDQIGLVVECDRESARAAIAGEALEGTVSAEVESAKPDLDEFSIVFVDDAPSQDQPAVEELDDGGRE